MSKSTYNHQKKAIAKYEDKISKTHTKIQIRATKELKQQFDEYIKNNNFSSAGEALKNLLNIG